MVGRSIVIETATEKYWIIRSLVYAVGHGVVKSSCGLIYRNPLRTCQGQELLLGSTLN